MLTRLLMRIPVAAIFAVTIDFAHAQTDAQTPPAPANPEAQQTQAGSPMTPAEAYRIVRQAGGGLKEPSPIEAQALAIIEGAPEAIMSLLAADLAQAQSMSGPDRYLIASLFHGFLSEAQQLAVARLVVQQTEFPPPQVLEVLATHGTQADLPAVLAGIRRSPDGDGIVLGRTLAARPQPLPQMLLRLEELAAERPGIWADAVDLQLRRPVGTLRRALELRRNQGEPPLLPEPPAPQP